MVEPGLAASAAAGARSRVAPDSTTLACQQLPAAACSLALLVDVSGVRSDLLPAPHILAHHQAAPLKELPLTRLKQLPLAHLQRAAGSRAGKVQGRGGEAGQEAELDCWSGDSSMAAKAAAKRQKEPSQGDKPSQNIPPSTHPPTHPPTHQRFLDRLLGCITQAPLGVPAGIVLHLLPPIPAGDKERRSWAGRAGGCVHACMPVHRFIRRCQ